MFERFIKPARDVVVGAQEQARELRHDWIGTEHIVLALLRSDDKITAAAFERLGLDPGTTRTEVVADLREAA